MRAYVTEMELRRRTKGWTQSDLAFRVDCSVAMISAIERGDRRPGEELEERIRDALGFRSAQTLYKPVTG